MRKSLKTLNINMIWSSLIIDELIKNGITSFFISPGNRNVPIISALAYNEKALKKICIDERAAAYRALGHAKASGKPGVVVCTSGTALSNYYPAVIEAHRDELPLIILSADRPAELTGSDANQTISQERIFGQYCLKNLYLPAPSLSFPLQSLVTKIDNIANTKTGPVHINLRFRDPLAPTEDRNNIISGRFLKDAEKIFNSTGPYTGYPETKLQITGLDEINNIINKTRRGLLIIGRLHPHTKSENIVDFARKLNWPLFADIGSSVKHLFKDDEKIFTLDHPESIRIIKNYKPHTVLHLGFGLVSKNFYEKILFDNDINYIMANSSAGLQDPAHRLKFKIQVDINSFIENINIRPLLNKKTGLTESLCRLKKGLDDATPANELSFPLIAGIVNNSIKKDSALFLGNSLTVRAFDNISYNNEKRIDVVVNRGVSGIEGNIATAAGYAESSGKPTTVVTGDISLIHDINSLLFLKDITEPVVIIVVNNNGGRIFERLPLNEFPEILYPYVAAPHGLGFESLARQFSIPYYRIKTPADLVKIYENALQKHGHSFIEVILDPEKDLEIFNKRKNVKI